MSISLQKVPTSRCRLGMARCDITPPVGIYHRFWGAAKQDRATGVHRRLTATALVLQPSEPANDDQTQILIGIDHCLFRPPEMEHLLSETSRLIDMPAERIIFAFSHTHSGGNLSRSRAELPGGDLIGPYLDGLPVKIAAAYQQAAAALQPVVLSFASADCRMGHHRDYRDDQSAQFVCGFNPDQQVDLPVNVVRAGDETDRTVAVIVNYPCHPTTLAWQNSLISPDYVGALRETVETATGAPCLFLLAPCGDIGPAHGFVGDVDVADRNGRQVGYAALEALESLPASSGCDFVYRGPVVSGATIGYWEYEPQSTARTMETGRFRRRQWELPLPYRSDIPTVAEAEAQLDRFLADEAAARTDGDENHARDLRAMAERSRRLLERIRPLPQTEKYPFVLDVTQIGDAFWIALEGEPYHALQQSLMERFPHIPLIFATLANGSRSSYLPRRVDYDKPLYQVEIALLAKGSLEAIFDACSDQIEHWLSE